MGQELRILVVDDDEVMRELIAEVLEDFEIIQACDGQDAIDKIPKLLPNLIITDIRMPRKGGDEVVKFAKRFDSKIPIIVMTAYSNLNVSNECIRMGADSFIAKPFPIDRLREEVGRCLRV